MSGKPNDKMFKTMIEKFGSEAKAREWFKQQGSKGGSAPHSARPFQLDRALARRSGRLGGLKSRRGKPVDKLLTQ